MIKKISKFVRDICMLMTLVFLVTTAFNRQFSFIQAHKKSVIHELDQDFLNHLYNAQKQIHLIKQLSPFCKGTQCNITIQKLEDEISSLESEYKENSPGLAFLGPIGTASILIKEKQVSKKLLILINQMTELLATLMNTKSYIDIENTTISQALNVTKELIAKLQDKISQAESSVNQL